MKRPRAKTTCARLLATAIDELLGPATDWERVCQVLEYCDHFSRIQRNAALADKEKDG